MIRKDSLKVAIVHDWLSSPGGAEKVLEQILYLFPEAHVYTLFDFLPDDERAFVSCHKITTSFLQKVPFARRKYRALLPLMPTAISRFDLTDYDLVISSSHAVAKGVRTRKGRPHICYCHTPMRYAWDMKDVYLDLADMNKGLKRLAANAILHYIRKWDHRNSDRVTDFIANSAYIADRIRRLYGRDATVIHPPVDTDGFTLCTEKENFYLTASRMVSYKRLDLIVKAFSKMPDRKLVVIGEGPEHGIISSLVSGNITIMGRQDVDTLRSYMQRAQAFVFAAEEDFGIIAVEAQACGTPVIAFRQGGVRESVKAGQTGTFFEEQTVEGIVGAVERFETERETFDPGLIRENAERFSIEIFRENFKAFVDSVLAAY